MSGKTDLKHTIFLMRLEAASQRASANAIDVKACLYEAALRLCTDEQAAKIVKQAKEQCPELFYGDVPPPTPPNPEAN